MKIVDGEEIFGLEDTRCLEEDWCERCGELEPFTIVVMTDPQYCLYCTHSEWLSLSEDDYKQIEIIQTKAKINYFKERIEGLEEYLWELE